ncbi:MAG: hypothetical protein ABSB50_17310 [Terracidiphilus sp.]|jgi:hypothetical protein
MNRTILLGYQLLTGASDTVTGTLLIITPAVTLEILHLHVSAAELIFPSLVGSFVLSVGLSCLYGALVAYRGGARKELEMIWLLTAFTRASVAIFVFDQVLAGTLPLGWLAIAGFDAGCVLIQGYGLRKGWLAGAIE